MKNHHLLLIAACFFGCAVANAQKKAPVLYLRNEVVQPVTDLSTARLDSFNTHTSWFHNKTTAVLQFETLPTEEQRKELLANGVALLDYIPQNAYIASFTGKLNAGLLQKEGARTITTLTPKQKMHPTLAAGQIPTWAIKAVGTVDVQMAFPKTFTEAEVANVLKEKNIPVVSSTLHKFHILTLRIPTNRLQELAGYPFVTYLQPALPKEQVLNFNSRTSSRGIVLNTSVADGGRGLNGEGVVIGIGDDADVQYHVDFSSRLIDRTTSSASYHGTHTHGTAAGAGIVNELYRGFAPKATIVSEDFSNILINAPVYVQDYDMVVTNNS